MLKKFVSIKPLHVSVFFQDHIQGVLRCALCLCAQSTAEDPLKMVVKKDRNM